MIMMSSTRENSLNNKLSRDSFIPGFSLLAVQFSRPIFLLQKRQDSESSRILKFISSDEHTARPGEDYFIPFSSCSICSLVKDVLFLCNFLFSLSLSWVSSSALELCSLLPSLMASFIPSLPYSLKEAASEKSEKKSKL